MEESAFRLLRKGLPEHLHSRLIYNSTSGNIANVYARGLGVLPVNKQIEQLIDWLTQMALQIPNSPINKEIDINKDIEIKNQKVIPL